ncbi:MAG: hypothetical protein AAGE61_02230, partial [Pseudomonadota bacterium]
FFECWWAALKPIVGSQDYVETASRLRARAESNAFKLNPPPLREKLIEIGYSPRELDEILDMIDVISHGNFMQVAAVFAAPILLEGGSLSGANQVGADAQIHKPDIKTPFVLIEPHHALSDLNAIYVDVMKVLRLPFVNTDYRCFSRWPSYFDLTWRDLRNHIDTPTYEELVLDMHNEIASATVKLPNPNGITADDLIAAAEKDASAAEVLAVTRLFLWLLPGLVTNVAFFRAQLVR